MNRNQLKIIACVSMLLDHIGVLIFPQVVFLRWAGRLAMPLFAFFIGEGCIHTSNRKKYFLSVLGLAAGCQAVYVADDIITSGMLTLHSPSMFFNILFTFAVSIAGCFQLVDIRKACTFGDEKNRRRRTAVFVLFLACVSGVCTLFYQLRKNGIASMQFDYGICGILLPMCTVLFDKKAGKLAGFSCGLIAYCCVFTASTPYVWFSLLVIPLLLLYNSKPGSRKFKYLFYVFYPAHLAILYLISMLIK